MNRVPTWDETFNDEFDTKEAILIRRFHLVLCSPKFQKEFEQLSLIFKIILTMEETQVNNNLSLAEIGKTSLKLKKIFECLWGVNVNVLYHDLKGKFLLDYSIKAMPNLFNNYYSYADAYVNLIKVEKDYYTINVSSSISDQDKMYSINRLLGLIKGDEGPDLIVEKKFNIEKLRIKNAIIQTEVFNIVPKENWLNIYKERISENAMSKNKASKNFNVDFKTISNISEKSDKLVYYFNNLSIDDNSQEMELYRKLIINQYPILNASELLKIFNEYNNRKE